MFLKPSRLLGCTPNRFRSEQQLDGEIIDAAMEKLRKMKERKLKVLKMPWFYPEQVCYL